MRMFLKENYIAPYVIVAQKCPKGKICAVSFIEPGKVSFQPVEFEDKSEDEDWNTEWVQ